MPPTDDTSDAADPTLYFAKHGDQVAHVRDLAMVMRAMSQALGELLRPRLEVIERRLAELEARPVLRACGQWQHGSIYSPGDVVEQCGDALVCSTMHLSVGSAPDPAKFQLLVEGGRERTNA